MGCGSQLLTMISILIITLLMMMILSSQRTHILTLMNAAESDMYFMKQNGKFQVEKISGIDENEIKQAMIVEKFRSLLGLKSFHKRVHSKSNDHSSEFLSPSPSPAPAPTPLLHLHPHLHHPSHHPHWNQQVKKPHHDENRGRTKRVIILVAVLVSLGVAALVGVFGLIFFCRKYTKHKKKPKRTMPLFTSNKGTTSHQNSSRNKVSLNPGLDLFYLDALGEDIEQHASSLRKTFDDNNVSSSSTKEVVPVFEEIELVKGESVIDDGNFSCEDKIISEHCHSSDDDDDDESFHSFVDSQSNNARLSNASACSLSDTQSLSPQNHQFPSSPQKTTLNTFSQQLQFSPKHEDKEVELEHEHEIEIETTVQCSNTSTSLPPPPPPSPPPPPPPTPPLQMPLFSLHSLTFSSRRVSSHSPLSDTFSGSNLQSPEKESLSPSPSNPIKSSPSSIPPPPCPPPPPFLKGNSSNSAKTPPPPPSHFPQFTPLGKDGSPLPKLKPLHWDKVRAAPNRTMVWDKLRSSSFELDEEMIESLFGYNLQNSIKNDETKSKTPSPSQHVLDPKRLQNITILSKALNATAEQVCEALMQGKGLSLQQLEALVKMVPTKEEESKLFNYKGDINELGSAEKFVRAMLSVPFAFQRVESMLYKETFDDEVVHLRNSFSMLEEACKELRSSRLFLKLLEAVLKTGNRMNVGTIRGGAKAFKLDALLKLSDVKGTDGKTTLLHFVVQEIVRSEGIRVSDSIMGKISQKNNKNRTEEEKEEDYRRMGLELVSGLSTELYNVKKTATIDLDVIASSVSNLSDGMTRLQHLVDKELYEDERSKNFVHSMKFFLNYVGRNLKELRGDEDRVLARVKEIAEYFHGDVISKEDANPLRIFVIVRDFMGMLDNVCKELRKSKVARTPNPLAPFR